MFLQLDFTELSFAEKTEAKSIYLTEFCDCVLDFDVKMSLCLSVVCCQM